MSALLGLECEADSLELLSVGLWLAKALRHVIVSLLSLQLRLISFLFELLLIDTHILDLCFVLLHLYHDTLHALHLISVEDGGLDELG